MSWQFCQLVSVLLTEACLLDYTISTKGGFYMLLEFLRLYGATYILIGIVLLLLLGLIISTIYGRLIRDRKEKTVPAVFLYRTMNRGMIRLQDRGRLANFNNQNVMIENCVLAFQVEGSDKIMKFVVNGDFAERWKAEQKGRLTYKGKRFVAFIVG